MRISQAGIHSGLPTTRYAAPASNRRERHLGLRRKTPAHITAHPGARARVPLLAALRHAARSPTRVQSGSNGLSRGVSAAPRLRRSDAMTWAQPHDSGSRRPRPRSAAPWRG
jgi:hypothetical protein